MRCLKAALSATLFGLGIFSLGAFGFGATNRVFSRYGEAVFQMGTNGRPSMAPDEVDLWPNRRLTDSIS